MRILAIRGENLASLYGAFEVRFDEAPIADAGLFCISGPTGAGKSTLLDALCLALYGRTPRLTDQGGIRIGHADEPEKERLASNDVRALLSRGTASGYAEVDFEGSGGRFRATWEVRRARNRPGGRLQTQTMKLVVLGDDRPIGEGLTGVLGEIQARVGYSFEEFCRAVLLPQFEFTNFLRAPAKQRADILERVTATGLYTAVSTRAHDRAAGWRKRLEALDLQVKGTVVLDAADRAGLEGEVALCEAGVEQVRAELDGARAAVAWHEQARSLDAALVEAEGALGTARERAAAAEPRRAELAAVEAAQPLRAPRDDAATAARRAADVVAEVAQRAGAVQALGVSAEETRAHRQGAETAALRARANAEALAPALEAARRLDAALLAARETAQARRGAHERAEVQIAESRRELAGLASSEERERAVVTAAEAWLAEHRAEVPLADAWTRWDAELGRHGAAVVALRAAEAALAHAEAAAVAAEGRHGEAAAREAGAARCADEAASAATQAQEAADAVDLAGLRGRREALTARAVALGEAGRLCRAAMAAAARETEARAEAAEATGRAETALADIARLGDDCGIAEARHAEARDAFEAVHRSLGQEGLRATLKDGVPCPVCGSERHPWAGGAPVALLEERRDRVVALEGELKVLRERHGAARRDHALAVQAAAAAAKEADRASAEKAEAAKRFGAVTAEAGFEQLGPVETAVPGLDRRSAEVEAELREVKEAEGQGLDLAREAARLRQEADGARAKLDGVRKALHDAEQARRDALAAIDRSEQERRRRLAERDEAETVLAAVLAFRAGWEAQARAEPAGFRIGCRAIVDAVLARRAEAAAATARLGELAGRLGAARARLSEREELLATAAGERAAAEAEVERLAGERRLLLEGRDTADVERVLGDAIREAERRREEARSAAEDAERRLAVAREAHANARERAATAEAEAAAATERLEAALVAAGIDRVTLDGRLARAHDWIVAERRELVALAEDVRAADTLHDERRRTVEAHLATGRPALELAEAAERVGRSREELSVAEVRRDEVRGRLRNDDDARRRRGSLDADREAMRKEAGPWLRLADLIGSSDGAKFRLFAQGLTFDVLLDAANAHLRDLARRYRLMRVPGEDLDLQVVDQDLGDEIRSLNSLSGGETFLVSLALALGLATLSTRADHAKTLFIDEGFGTLDRDTLDHAMVALEGLQHGGRTVGLISHVPELHERVGVQVRVERVAVGKSRVTVHGPR